jgi:ActR/RegA family two-component response regulator
MRLVLCDDNRIFCEALAVAHEARGHRALAIATTADESVAAVARHLPDACLLDLRFHSGGDGLGTARLIRDVSGNGRPGGVGPRRQGDRFSREEDRRRGCLW